MKKKVRPLIFSLHYKKLKGKTFNFFLYITKNLLVNQKVRPLTFTKKDFDNYKKFYMVCLVQ